MMSLSRSNLFAVAALLLVCALVYYLRIASKAFLLAGLITGGLNSPAQKTVILIDGSVKLANVKRLGVNLGMQNYYDARQILGNLISRNPGFEGQQWQTVLQCKTVTQNSCTDWARSTGWPENFLTGGNYEFILGGAKGRSGTITGSTSIGPGGTSQITVQLSPGSQVPTANDYLIVRKETTGNGTSGWAPVQSGGGAITTESYDLSPNTPGKQALRLEASLPGQSAGVKTYFDSTPGLSFVQLNGEYIFKFRAKGIGSGSHLSITVKRFVTKGDTGVFFSQNVPLTKEWKDYSLSFEASEHGNSIGTAEVDMIASGASLFLDDVSLAQTRAPENPSVFRNEVVATLLRLHPGVLRYMDSGMNFGSTLDNMLAPEEARERTGFDKHRAEATDIPVGLHDFLVLCKTIGAEPWYTVQIGTSEKDVTNLIDYLAGAPTTPYGKKRADLGQVQPWTSVFPIIHLEYANETWNSSSQGGEIHDPIAYGEHAADIFKVARAAPGFTPAKFDLILNGFVANLYWMGRVLPASDGYDTVDFAPYIFGPFDDDSSEEAIFGPMLAEPEMADSLPTGIMQQQVKLATNAKRPAKVAIYETNIGTTDGTVPQASVDSAIPSVAAGLAAVEHMLLMMRDLGIRDQNTFTLGQYGFGFNNTKTHERETSPVWGIVLDMGGATGRVRPSFLAQELVNRVILPTMLTSVVTGNDPTWNQPASTNSKLIAFKPHILQSFAFTDGLKDTVIVFNLSRTEPKTVYFAGAHGPQGAVSIRTLTSAKITDSNELSEKVKPTERNETVGAVGSKPFILPPFSMTAISSVRAK